MVATIIVATKKEKVFAIILLKTILILLPARPRLAIKLMFCHTYKKRRCPNLLVLNSGPSDGHSCERTEKTPTSYDKHPKVCNKGFRPLHTPGMQHHTRKHHIWHCSWQLFWISEVPNYQKQSINDASLIRMLIVAHIHIKCNMYTIICKITKNITITAKTHKKNDLCH